MERTGDLARCVSWLARPELEERTSPPDQQSTRAEFVELRNAEACCGFGGTFSVKYPEISVAILDEKIEAIEQAKVQAVVAADASCLMQIGGRLSRKGSNVRVMHLAELLASQ